MSVLQSVLLGVLQGIAEFLPISSSGHLALAQHLFNLKEVPLLYDIILHLATLLAVVLFFRNKIIKLFACLFRWIAKKEYTGEVDENDFLCGNDTIARRTILAVIFTTSVTGFIGILTSKLIPELSIKFTCAGFLVTAALLIFSGIIERKNSEKKGNEEAIKGISIFQSLFIGFMQGIGTLPGISRSGSTICGAQFCGVNRDTAGEYSFIVSIPAILGAFILEAKDLGEVSSSIGALTVLAGFFAAFVSGYISLIFLMKLIKKGKLKWFSLYLIPLGITGLLFL